MSESLDENILAVIGEEPGIRATKLHSRINAPQKVLDQHIQHLSSDQQITVHKMGTVTRYYIMDDERAMMVREFVEDLNRVTESIRERFMSAPTPVQEAMQYECQGALSTLLEQADSISGSRLSVPSANARINKVVRQCAQLERAANRYLKNDDLLESVSAYAENVAMLFSSALVERDRIISIRGKMDADLRAEAKGDIATLDNIMRSLPLHIEEVTGIINNLDDSDPPQYPHAHRDMATLMNEAKRDLKETRESLDMFLEAVEPPHTGRKIDTFSDEELGRFMDGFELIADPKELNMFDNEEYAALIACAICAQEGREPSDLEEDEYATLLEYVKGHRIEPPARPRGQESGPVPFGAPNSEMMSALSRFESPTADDQSGNPLFGITKSLDYLQWTLDRAYETTMTSMGEYQLVACLDRVKDLFSKFNSNFFVIEKKRYGSSSSSKKTRSKRRPSD